MLKQIQKYWTIFPYVVVVMFILFGNMYVVAADTRGVLPLGTSIVDVVRKEDGKLIVFTDKLEGYELPVNTTEWLTKNVTISAEQGDVSILRISEVQLTSDSILLASGNIQVFANAKTKLAMLVSTDDGSTWSAHPYSSELTAEPDYIRVCANGFVFMVDITGSLWTSKDFGRTWKPQKLPSTIRNNTVSELDMLSESTGVCIDKNQTVYITTDGWKTVTKPNTLPDSDIPTSFHDNSVAGQHNLYIWNNTLLLTDGVEVFVTTLPDIQWKKWQGIQVTSVVVDHTTLVTINSRGEVQRWTSMNAAPVTIAKNILLPNIMHSAKSSVIMYRSDTGPVTVTEKGAQQHRFFSKNIKIQHPKQIIKTNLHEWGIGYTSTTDLMVDILLRTATGEWYRDTTIRAGGMNASAVGLDSLVFESGGTMMVYDREKRFYEPLEVREPLTVFMRIPIQKMTVQLSQEMGAYTRTYFTDYKYVQGALVCNRLMEKTATGLESSEYGNTIDKDAVLSIIDAINRKGSRLPTAKEIPITAADKQDYQTWLDSILKTSSAFVQADVRKSAEQVQREQDRMKQRFLKATDHAQNLEDREVAASLLALRFSTKERPVSCKIILENAAGEQLLLQLENTDSPHPPLLTPWRVQYRKKMWLCYDQTISSFYRNSIPESIIPARLQDMQKKRWYLLGVANYIDSKELGKRYLWYE